MDFFLDSAIQFNSIDWILDKTNKFKKDNHIIYMYDNYDKLNFKELKTQNIKYNHDLIKFNDKLTEKYRYYGYLYENILSIKVLIDIMVQNIISGGSKFEGDNPLIVFELNKMKDKIFLDSKLKKCLHDMFLYGTGYLIKKINPNKYDLQVINPHYVRIINKNKKKRKIMCLKIVEK